MIFNETAQQETAQSKEADLDRLINEMKARKKQNDIQFDIKMNHLNLAKLEQSTQLQTEKAEVKKNKINSDLISGAIKQGPVAVGGNMLNEFTAGQEAQTPRIEGLL